MISTGRDVDGSFMAVHPSTWSAWWHDAVDAAGCGYDQLGYEFDPHHLRRSWLSYGLRAPAVMAAIAEETSAPRPEAGEGPAALIDWLEGELTRARSVEHSLIFGAAVTEFAGQSPDGAGDDEPASDVSFRHYYRALGDTDDATFVQIVDTVDVIAAHELDGAELDTSPDEHDTAAVLSIDDPDWLLSTRPPPASASALTGSASSPGRGS